MGQSVAGLCGGPRTKVINPSRHATLTFRANIRLAQGKDEKSTVRLRLRAPRARSDVVALYCGANA